MKKIAFMFAAAALFAACGGATEKPATEEENNVEEQSVETPEVCEIADSCVWNKVLETVDTTGMEAEAKEAAFEAAKAEMKAACEEGKCCKEGEETAEETAPEAAPEA